MNVKPLIMTALIPILAVLETAVDAKTYDILESCDTSWKTYMGYKCITNTRSLQYKLQQKAETDENGLRVYNDRYMVAVGTPFAKVGDYISVTLDTGTVLDCVVGDSKGDRLCHYVYSGGEIISYNVVEFIVDTNKLDKNARRSGDISSIDGFEGDVISIEVIEDED